MEESEKRRERLKAMRMEAVQAEVSGIQDSSPASGSLSNPLLDTSTSPSTQDGAVIPRFDYYTDPMSAFSGNKKRTKESNLNPPAYFSSPFGSSSPMSPFPPSHSGPRNADMTPMPAHQLQMNLSPDHRSYRTPMPPPRLFSWRSPAEMANPFSGRGGSPGSIPGSWNKSSGRASYDFSPSSSLGRGASPSPNSGRGWVHRSGNSPSPNSGRGWVHQSGNSPSPSSGFGSGPGSGRSKGRGKGHHSFVSAQEQPHRFYNKSMVEDPWRFLKPVVRSLVKTPDTLKSWLPKSINMKKAKVSEEVPDGFKSQSSLAECLALSFEDAINE